MTKKNETEILIETGRELKLDGKDYIMRRLDVRDVMAFANLFMRAFGKVRADMGDEALAVSEEAGTDLFFDAFLGNPVGFADVLGPVIGLTGAEFLKLSPAASNTFTAALQESEDMNAFFDAALAMMKMLGSLSRRQ
jgi:hypothetical protein